MNQKKITSTPSKKQQLIDEIIQNIASGSLKNGERLATVRRMSEQFNVSLSVVQAAMKELIDQGFVECRGASGFYINTQQTASKEKYQDTPDQIYFSAVHHSDLVWRYTFEEYDKIREEQLLHLLKLAEKYPQFYFAVEQAYIMDVFLKVHPETKNTFKKLIEEGRFECLGGFCIPDLNMISGESITRNLLSGKEIYRELFGIEPKIACMSDAFGMCSQLPQILIKCGFKYLLPGRRPNLPEEISKVRRPFNWKAMDNTEIIMAYGVASVTHLGCDTNVPMIQSDEEQLIHSTAELKNIPGLLLAHYMTEEGNIKEDIFYIIDSLNRNPGRKIEFGSNLDFFNRVKSESLLSYQGEMNPVFTGCYSTHISIKQKLRKAEYALTAAEIRDVFSGRKQNRKKAWTELFLSQFHDAACGCHTDLANLKINEKIDFVLTDSLNNDTQPAKDKFSIVSYGTGTSAQLIRSKYVPEGVEAQKDGDVYYYQLALPSCGVKTFRMKKKNEKNVKKGKAHFKTDFFEVDFSTSYPVIKNLNGENVFSNHHFGEILFREDYGTMWTEQYTGLYHGYNDQKEKVTDITEGPVFIKVTTHGEVLYRKPTRGNIGNQWPGFESLKFQKEYIFPKHSDSFRLKVKLDWKGCNTQINIRFPVELKGINSVATYEVPFGCVVRKPYFEVKPEFGESLKMLANRNDYINAHGNWPALNWVNYSDLQKGLTVANTGTPGHQLVNNEIIITLLRSGTSIKDGGMVPQPGSFENGIHEYEFAFCAHAPYEMEKAVELGRQLNMQPEAFAEFPADGQFLQWNCENIQLSAMYQSNDGIVIRMYESVGRQTTITLDGKLMVGKELYETDMAEKMHKKVQKAIAFRPFEVKTFIIK